MIDRKIKSLCFSLEVRWSIHIFLFVCLPSSATKGNISSMLQAIFPVNSVHPELASKPSREASGRKQSSSRGAMEAVSSGIHRKKLRSDHAVAPEPVLRERGAEASAWPLTEDMEEEVERERATVSPNPSTLSFVNIDSYEPDSSDAEEDGENDEDRELDDSSADLDPSAGLQRRLDSMINDLGKDFDYLTGLHSYLRNRLGASGGGGDDTDVASCSSQDVCDGGRDLAESASEQLSPAAPERTRCDLNCETVCASSADTDMDRCGVGTLEVKGSEVAGSLNSAENSADAHGSSATASAASSTEMVVRPKIRKQTSETHLEKKRTSSTSSSSALAEETLPFCRGGGSGGISGRSTGKVKCGSAPPFFLTQTERPGATFLFDLPKPERCRGGGGNVPMTRSHANGTARKSQTTKADEDDEDDFWEDLEEFSEKCASARRGDDRYDVYTQFNIPSCVCVCVLHS